MKDKKILNDVLFYLFLLLAILLIVISQSVKAPEKSKIVGIHIKGEVISSGYYELKSGSRVKDAISKAGGETENADLTEVNLARKLVDGEEIIIPAKNLPTAPQTNIVEKSIVKEKPVKEEFDGIVNINTADIEQLSSLDGIGESIAGAIIDYRTKNGPFKRIEDLKNVKGIGESKFNAIKNKISV